jgi:PKD repeat protein
MKEKILILILCIVIVVGILGGCVQKQPTTNKKPTVDFEFSPLLPKINEIVNFTDKSIDPDGNITAWAWDLDGDGTIDSTTQNPTYKYTDPGVYSVTLTVTDDDNATSSITKFITIMKLNLPPTANFTYSVVANLTVNFTDISTDVNGNDTIMNWTWDFGDGNISYQQNPQHKYAVAGNYNVILTVKDEGGLIDSTTKEIQVT